MNNYDQDLKEQVIADYLSGGGSFRQLQAKYGADYRSIHRWVKEFKDSNIPNLKSSKRNNVDPIDDLPKDIKQLQDALRQAKLYNKLLEALVDIGKEKYGIDLRKKNGTKQS